MKKKPNDRIRHLLILMSAAVCLAAFVGCAPVEVQQGDWLFRPEKISCEVHASSEPEDILHELKKKQKGLEYRDRLPYRADAKARLKALADEGNPQAMAFWGGFQYADVVVEIMNLRSAKSFPSAQKFFPDDFHDRLVMAFSYLYLATMFEGPDQQKLIEVAAQIDGSRNNESGLETPPAWIEEAKANVETWKKLCSK